MLDEAREAKKANSRWRGWHHKLSRKAWKTAPWIALAAGVGLAASGEYELARMVGINQYVAPLLPVSHRRLLRHRVPRQDGTSRRRCSDGVGERHLSTCPSRPTSSRRAQSAPWWLTTFVVLIFVAVIWRVHSLMHDAGTDGHGGTDTATGTDGRTSTAAYGRPGWYAPVSPYNHPSGTDSYGTSASTPPARTAHGPGSYGACTAPCAPHPPAARAANAGVTSAYSDRTSGVQAAPDGARVPVRSDRRPYRYGDVASETRTSTVTARTASPDGVPAARTSTASARSLPPAPTPGRTRTATPARTDAELLPLVQELPRETDGFVNI